MPKLGARIESHGFESLVSVQDVATGPQVNEASRSKLRFNIDYMK